MYNPYWLLYEIEKNKLYFDKEEIRDYLEMDSLRLQYTKNTVIEYGEINDKRFEIEIVAPKLTGKKGEYEFDDVVPVITKQIQFWIDENRFKYECLSYPFFGKTDTDRVKKANKVLKNLYTEFKLEPGTGYFTIVDWESTVKYWKEYIYKSFEISKYKH